MRLCGYRVTRALWSSREVARAPCPRHANTPTKLQNAADPWRVTRKLWVRWARAHSGARAHASPHHTSHRSCQSVVRNSRIFSRLSPNISCACRARARGKPIAISCFTWLGLGLGLGLGLAEGSPSPSAAAPSRSPPAATRRGRAPPRRSPRLVRVRVRVRVRVG